MRSSEAAARWLVLAMAFASLASLVPGCRSLPLRDSVPKDSSMLAVDVRFPVPLGRDPTLIRVHLARGPIHAGMQELPPLVSTGFVKGSRAYLLDPEPGTYSLVAVDFDYGPPLRTDPAAGVTGVVASGADAGQTIVLPAEMIQRTRTTIGYGLVKFMGSVEATRGERVHADTRFDEALQKVIAERIRPGVTSEAGLASILSVTWTLDRETSTFSDDPSALDAFHRDARADFGASPWARLFPLPETDRERRRARRTPRAAAETAVAAQEPAEPTAIPAPQPAPSPTAIPIPEAPEPEAADESDDSRPEETTVAALQPPPGHPLAEIELGMTGDDVEAILGEPDDRERSRTRRAWIPFYTGPDAHRITWIYTGRGRVVFSLDDGSLEVVEVVYAAPEAP